MLDVSVARKSASFTRPANTTAYAAGDLAANSATASSVSPMSFKLGYLIGFTIAKVKLQKTGTALTNAQFRVHVYSASPTVATTGDNGVYASVVSGNTSWLGSFDGTFLAGHADGCSVNCVPTEGVIGSESLGAEPTLYALIEVLAAYTPASAEVFTATLIMEDA